MNKHRKLQQRCKLLMKSREKVFWDTAKYGTYQRGVNDHDTVRRVYGKV